MHNGYLDSPEGHGSQMIAVGQNVYHKMMNDLSPL
jgi:hypothetical protein